MALYTNDHGVLEVRHRHEVVRIQAWGADSVRVRASQFRMAADSAGALADDPPDGATSQVRVEGTQATLTNGRLRVEVTLDPAESNPEPRITFCGPGGDELLAESRKHFWMPGARVFTGNRSGAYEIHQQFAAYPGERLYGLGQRTHGRLNLKGLALDLIQRNGEVSIPFVLSDRGYGLLWNSPAIGRVEFAENATRWQAGQAREIDYWFTAAGTPSQILARYADVTGHAPDLPAWASGFWQSKLRYRSQDELLAVAREYRRRGLPLSVIVADFFHWPAMGDYRFDPAEYDPTNPRTRARVWDLIRKNYLSLGVRVFWLDASEPELNPAHPANLALYAGPGAEVAGVYPRDNARLFAEGMAAAGQAPTVLLCRSAWAGSQRYGAAVCSGDIPEDQFLFGPDLLVSPVLEPGGRARDVHLPPGRTWVDAATDDHYEGGVTISVPVSPDRIPVFVSAGAEVLDVVR